MILKDINGLRARTRRGSFGKNWWTRLFTDLFENLVDRIEIRKGRNSARAGSVTRIELECGKISYSFREQMGVMIRGAITPARDFRGLGDEIITSLSQGSLDIAFLLAGAMAPETEAVLRRALDSSGSPGMNCSCGEGVMPCRHVLAASYLTAETMDSDPFVLLEFLGVDKERLLNQALPARKNSLSMDHSLMDSTGSFSSPSAEDSTVISADSEAENTELGWDFQGQVEEMPNLLPCPSFFWGEEKPVAHETDNSEEAGINPLILQEVINEISNGWAGDLDPAVELKAVYARAAAWTARFNLS